MASLGTLGWLFSNSNSFKKVFFFLLPDALQESLLGNQRININCDVSSIQCFVGKANTSHVLQFSLRWLSCFLLFSIWPWLISLLNSFQPHEEDLSSNNGKDTCSLCCKELGKAMWGITVEEQIRKQVIF